MTSLVAAVLAFSWSLYAALQAILGRHSKMNANVSSAVFLFASLLAVALWRVRSIAVDVPFDPDESSFIAQAVRSTHDPLPWIGFDGTTSGPLNTWALNVAHFAGLPFSYQSARIAAYALIAGALVAFYFAMRVRFGEAPARLATMLGVTFFCTASYDRSFVTYSSELVSIALLSVLALVTACLTVVRRPAPTMMCAALAGVFAGAIPFAKLQSIPIDAVLCATIVVVLLRRHYDARLHIAAAALFIAALLVVPSAIVLPVAIAGGWTDFTISYIYQPLVYARGSVAAWAQHGHVSIVKNKAFALFALTCAALIAGLFALVFRASRRDGLRASVWLAPAAVFVAACYAIAAPRYPWGHYLLYSILPLCALAGVALFLATVHDDRWNRPARTYAAVTLAVLTVLNLVHTMKLGNPFLGRQLAATIVADARTRNALDILSAQTTVSVWGWAPEIYVMTAAPMGTRDSITQFQMWPGPYQRYYLRRYVIDLRRSRPAYFVDAVRGARAQYGGLTIPANRHENYPVVAEYIAANYSFIRDVGGIRFYRRRPADVRTMSHCCATSCHDWYRRTNHARRGCQAVTATIDPQSDRLTLINVYEVEPEKQAELARALSESTEGFIKQQPGFISVSIHSSVDGKRVVNYAQWMSQEHFQAFMTKPETQEQLKAFAVLAKSVSPSVYKVNAVHSV